MAYVSTIISGAASLGVLIGLITGIFFLVLTALKWVSRVRASLYEEELRRQKRFLINKSYLAAAGTSGFPDTKPQENGFGSTLRGKNLQEKLEESFQGNVDSTENWSDHHADIKPPEKDPDADMIRVREVMEKMIEKMIGGPLDGTTVGQLSSHPAYLDMFTKYHNLLCRDLARLGFALHLSVVRNIPFELDPADSRQSNLKRLIKRIIAEAMALPNINEILLSPKISKESGIEDFKNKSYEDILSTAILNKIIGNFQNKNYKENDGTDGNPKPRLRNKKIRRRDNSDSKSDDDWSDTSRSDQLSLTIEEYIEEVTTTLEVSDDEKSDLSDFETTSNRRIPFPESGRTVVDGTDDENSDLEDQNTATELITSASSWEENWLFQKKRLRSTPNAHHPVPVPMLVPNPSEDYRALVGGVDADDLSDMSDCTDSVLEDFITTENLSTQTQNAEDPLVNNSEEGDLKQIEAAEESLCDKAQEEIVEDRMPANEAEDTICEDAFKEVEEFGTQEVRKDAEDDLASPTSPDVLSQKDRESSFQDFSHQYEEPKNSHSPSEGEIQISACTETSTEDTTTRCPLAEREKEKWNNPVPLAENPYSLENIERREQRKKNEYFRIGTYLGESIDFPEDLSSEELFPSKKEAEKLRFSRDYYVNASKHPSGMSSPCNNNSEDHAKKSADKIKAVNSLENHKLLIGKMTEVKSNEYHNLRIANKKEFCLPSVKELAKQFAAEDCRESKLANFNSQNKSQSKTKSQNLSTKEFSEKEFEIDYSTVPVSEIISNLQQAAEAPAKVNQNKEVYNHTHPNTQMEVWRTVDDNLVVEKGQENGKKGLKVEAFRFNGKEVHSLTARSISKEFREGLKNNSYQKVYPKVDRGSSGGESDQEGSNLKSSPTPSIDLKNMKKFWEEIITGNSTMQNKNKI